MRIKKPNIKGSQLHPTHNQIQMAAVEYCAVIHGLDLVHVPNELMRFLSEGQKINQVKQGVQLGFPDLILFEPRGIYHGLAIEIKTHKRSSLQENQIKWIDRLNEKGYYAKITVGLDETLDTIEEYLNYERT